jgi:phosphate starvation-inducible PhoH-like protein
VSPTQVKILVPGNHLMVGLLGQRDELLRLIEEAFPQSRIVVRGNEITVDGDDAEVVGRLFEELVMLLEQGQGLDVGDVGRTITMVKDDVSPAEVLTTELLRSARGRTVRPKTAGQKRYTDAIATNVVTFGIGPAGTGKSYLAVCARSTTPSTTCWATKGRSGCSSGGPSRWRRWRSCGAGRSTAASSSSTKRRTPLPSR